MVISASDRQRVKKRFEIQGTSVTEWATTHGFKREQVYAVLNGRTDGRRGTSHRIAVALGLKPSDGDASGPSGKGPESAPASSSE